MSSTRYEITLFSHGKIIEYTISQGETPKRAIFMASLAQYPRAPNLWIYEDNPDGSGCLICPEDEYLFYQVDPVLSDDLIDAGGEDDLNEIAAQRASRAVWLDRIRDMVRYSPPNHNNR
jgi:hypothetical protein